MRSSLICLFIAIWTHVIAQSAPTDINGLWQSTKSGAELFIEIQDSKATITSVGSSGMTQKVIGGHLYENIVFKGNNSWSAQRNAWIYPGVNGQKADQGRWEKGKILTLSLSADKNTLTGSGHWTFKRVQNDVNSANYLYFSLWGTAKDYISSIIELKNTADQDKLNKEIETFKKAFYRKVKEDPYGDNLGIDEIIITRIGSAESYMNFERKGLYWSIVEEKPTPGLRGK